MEQTVILDTTGVVQKVAKTLGQLLQSSVGRSITERNQQPVSIGDLQVISGLRYASKAEENVHEIIVSHALMSEKLSPGSFNDCVGSILNLLKGKEIGDISTQCVGKVPNKEDLESLINETIQCKVTKNALLHALDLSGFLGNITIEKSATNTMSVEQTSGYTYEIPPLFQVSARLDEPKVLCIDGYVESVSEIHHLLQGLNEAAMSCMLFVRGMSDDVVHTLKVNYDRGSLKVIPFVVRYDLEGANIINDIAVICGVDVVSSLKGELISSVNLADIRSISSATVHNNKFCITNRATRNSVNIHVKGLYAKRQESHESVAKFIDRRIKSLTSGHVSIRIPDDQSYVTRAQAIDHALRKIKNSLSYGVIEGELATKTIAVNFYANKCHEVLKNIGAVVS